jgi:hypothetical protein
MLYFFLLGTRVASTFSRLVTATAKTRCVKSHQVCKLVNRCYAVMITVIFFFLLLLTDEAATSEHVQ